MLLGTRLNSLSPLQEKNHIMGFDLEGLYCDEEDLEADFGSENEFESQINDKNIGNLKRSVLYSETGLGWEKDELISLFSKEKEPLSGFKSDGYLLNNRKGAVEWILGVNSHYGFNNLTFILAVNYYDRFISSVCIQKDKPWMSQLVAVASLSLAAKVEETRVPLLLDFQVVETEYVFEAKTIMRMELLILSTLNWKINPVTPLSFIDYIIRRLGIKNHLHSRFLEKCERILISTVTDPKFGSYLPSVLAAGTMLHVLKVIELDNVLNYQNELLNVLEMSKDKVDDCYKFILDAQASCDKNEHLTHKRKYLSSPNSPDGVIDAYLSSDSSNDSWYVTPINKSPPEATNKRSRLYDQQLRVAPLRHF